VRGLLALGMTKETIMPQKQVHETTDAARAGSTPHIVRYVLSISLVLAILAMIGVMIWGDAATTDSSGDANQTAIEQDG
jgi:hypothetical protein